MGRGNGGRVPRDRDDGGYTPTDPGEFPGRSQGPSLVALVATVVLLVAFVIFAAMLTGCSTSAGVPGHHQTFSEHHEDAHHHEASAELGLREAGLSFSVIFTTIAVGVGVAIGIAHERRKLVRLRRTPIAGQVVWVHGIGDVHILGHSDDELFMDFVRVDDLGGRDIGDLFSKELDKLTISVPRDQFLTKMADGSFVRAAPIRPTEGSVRARCADELVDMLNRPAVHVSKGDLITALDDVITAWREGRRA